MNALKALCTSPTSLSLERRAVYRIVAGQFASPFVLGKLSFEVRRAAEIEVTVLREEPVLPVTLNVSAVCCQ